MNDKKIKWTEQTPENIEYLKKKAGDRATITTEFMPSTNSKV
jgi:hypothetical protein